MRNLSQMSNEAVAAITDTVKGAASGVTKGTRGAVSKTARGVRKLSRKSLRTANRALNKTVGLASDTANDAVGIASGAVGKTVGLAGKAVRGSVGLVGRAARDVESLADTAVTGSVSLANRALTGTEQFGSDVVKGAKGVTVNTYKNALKGYADTLDYGDTITNDFVGALTDVTTGLIDGANTVVNATGAVTERILSDLFHVHATHVFNGAGRLAKQIADELGGIVRQIPYIGNACGYIIESVGGGVYHLVLEVGKFIGRAGRRVGQIAKKSTDLVVFTFTAARNQVTDTRDSINDLVTRLAHSLTTRKGKSLRAQGGSRRRSMRRRRSGVRRRARKQRGGGKIEIDSAHRIYYSDVYDDNSNLNDMMLDAAAGASGKNLKRLDLLTFKDLVFEINSETQEEYTKMVRSEKNLVAHLPVNAGKGFKLIRIPLNQSIDYNDDEAETAGKISLSELRQSYEFIKEAGYYLYYNKKE